MLTLLLPDNKKRMTQLSASVPCISYQQCSLPCCTGLGVISDIALSHTVSIQALVLLSLPSPSYISQNYSLLSFVLLLLQTKPTIISFLVAFNWFSVYFYPLIIYGLHYSHDLIKFNVTLLLKSLQQFSITFGIKQKF